MRHYPQGDAGGAPAGLRRRGRLDQLDDPRYSSLAPGDQVGKAGVESAYDSLLRGTNGESRVAVDASGQPTGGQLSARDPQPGNNLVLTIDDKVQQAGEDGIASLGLPGGFVAMNIQNGQLYGLGSSPSYDPAIFAKPRVPTSTYKALTSPANGAPLFDRATSGAYPTGSTFKPITALAALDSGQLKLGEIYQRHRQLPARRRQCAPQRRPRR